MGHFIIKAPNADVGYVIVNGGSSSGLFRMGNGQYVSVPNHPSYYRSGYISVSDPVGSAINLEISDAWGVNRRNIITYEIFKDYELGATLVKIFASSTKSSDNIIFGGQFISGSSLPSAPYRQYIGELLMRYYIPTYFGYQPMIYMYSDILDNYFTTGVLPDSRAMIP
jgi:hypothetical protein